MLKIKTTGVEDYLDGSANIKALVIGGPGAGKTRSSSFWPSPIFLDCENGRGSLADRNMPYAEIKSSKDMLDALEYLKGLEGRSKAQRQYQTVVVDTADSFQRIVKDEWVAMTRAQTFTGYDAWGYLDTKMQMLFTRLLNLDYNVLVLSHYKDKIIREGENQTREFTLQLQGAISDQIFNDFGLVGWLGTYWESGTEGRVQKRGLTFQPTPDKPFLKDRFNCTPKWLEITFTEKDYTQLFEAFFNRPEFEALGEGQDLGEIPDSDRKPAQPQSEQTSGQQNEVKTVSEPDEGGPTPTALSEIPLEKRTVPELRKIADREDVELKGNALKGEIITAIKASRAAQEQILAEATTDTPLPEPDESTADETSDAEGESPSEDAPDATSGGSEGDDPQPMTADELKDALGAEEIPDESATPPADAPTPEPQQAEQRIPEPRRSSAPAPGPCADCGTDLGEEWNDPSKRDYIRLSRAKYRRYLCTTCMSKASN